MFPQGWENKLSFSDRVRGSEAEQRSDSHAGLPCTTDCVFVGTVTVFHQAFFLVDSRIMFPFIEHTPMSASVYVTF